MVRVSGVEQGRESAAPRWAYLGPAGTFTERAALDLVARAPVADPQVAEDANSASPMGRAQATGQRAPAAAGGRILAGHRPELIPQPSVTAALAALRSGEVDAACVPMENSVEGAVALTQDELAHGDPLVIVAEAFVPVTFQLLGRPGTSIGRVRAVGSHPHALAQTREFLATRLPNAETVLTGSTAAAAAAVATGDLDAAVAAPVAAERYGLAVLADDIGAVQDAVTRFVLIRRPSPPPQPTGNDRTSMVLAVVDRPGSLLAMLTEFATRGINLTRLESRPTGARLGEYLFLVDADGHVADKAMADVLAVLVRHAALHRFLGSYPRMQGTAVIPPEFSADAGYDEAADAVLNLQAGRPMR